MSDTGPAVAILFADICGSTQLYETNGDVRAHRLVARTIDQLKQITVAQGGTVIKTIGDEIMATFPEADQAFIAGVKMQEQQSDQDLAISLGFHIGPVVRQGGDVFGDAVNVASRIAAMAHAGEILMTEDAVRRLSPPFRKQTRLLDKATVKGKREPISIYGGIWIDASDLTAIGSLPVQSAAPANPLILTGGGRDYVVSQRVSRFVLGRNEDSDLVVADAQVSRQHAVIEAKRDNFFLHDTSTNGTYVVAQGTEPVFLKRETIQLVGSGVLSLGRDPRANERQLVRFRRG